MLRSLAKLTRVEMKLFLREPFVVIFTIVFPLVVLTVLAGVFGDAPDPDFGGARPTDFYLAGYIGVVIAAVGLVAVPVHVAAYRERGVLRRLRASSVPAWHVVVSQVVVGLVMATVGSLVLLVVAMLAYDSSLPDRLGTVVVAFLVATLGFLALGFLIGGISRTARAAQALGMVLFFPMWLLSGAGPPPSVMSEGMRTVSDALPMTYAVRAIQDPWLNQGSNASELLLLGAILVVAGVVSTWLIRRS